MKISRFTLTFCCLLPCLASAAVSLPEVSQLFRQGQYAQALDKVNSFLGGNPKDPQARFLKGLIQAELNRTDDAIKTFTELTDDYPELPEPYNNLAVLHASQGQYERAKNSLEKAIRTHPSYATAHENLGDIYAKMASLAYDKALQLDKGNTSAQMKLALVKDIFMPAGIDKAKPASKSGPSKTTTTLAQDTSAKPEIPAKPLASSKIENTPTPRQPKPADTAKPAAVELSPERTVEEWAAAWSRRDVPAYLAFYASSFSTPRGMSRADWDAQRRERLSKPEFIKVTLSDMKTSGNDGNISVQFKQRYESNLLTSSTRKTLILEKQGGAWKITSEK